MSKKGKELKDVEKNPEKTEEGKFYIPSVHIPLSSKNAYWFGASEKFSDRWRKHFALLLAF